MKRILVLAVVVLVILGAVFVASGGAASLSPQPTPEPDLGMSELENLVTASGPLVPVRRANLALATGGQVIEIPVKVGDKVKKGDLLVRLDAAEMQAAVAMAQAQLDQAQAGATKEEIAAAQAAVETAQAQLARARLGPGVEDVAMAQANLERAQSAVRDAQSAYDKIKDDPAVGMFPQTAALESAIQQLKIAEASYNKVLKGALPEDIRIAESAVAAAQANLARVKAGARPEPVAVAQAGLDQARTALATKSLTAPFDGTVAVVNIKQGEMAMPGIPVITLGELSNLHLETDDLSETDIARIAVGQSVNVTFEALPGKIFAGTVTSIAPMATARQGGTNYTVTVEFEKLDPALRWGMTGHIEIQASR